MKKLHIGCGKKYLPGYLHVDIQKFDHIDVICSIDDIDKFFDEESIDEIYCCHILEHINRHNILNIISKLNKILVKGGKLRLSVPDFEAMCEIYMKDKNNLLKMYGLLYGGQKNDYDYHYITFDFDLMSNILEKIGFNNIMKYDPFDFLPDNFDDYSKSFIPHMDRKNGKMMSLNIIATKNETNMKNAYLGGVNFVL